MPFSILKVLCDLKKLSELNPLSPFTGSDLFDCKIKCGIARPDPVAVDPIAV